MLTLIRIKAADYLIKCSLFSLFLIKSISFAQISITADDFPAKGDTIRYSNTSSIFYNYIETGANFTWNFSNLVAQSQTLLKHADPDQEDFFIQALFGSMAFPVTFRATYFLPATELPIATLSNIVDVPIDNVYRFFRKTNQEVTAVGLSVSSMGLAIGKRADTIEVAYKFPITFGQSYESKGFVNIDLSAFAPFSLKQHRERISEVDGWGTITTPYGTFDCLRIHHIIKELDSIYIDLGNGPQWFPINIPTIHEYEWWAKGQKGPILKAKANEIFGFPIVNEIMFRDKFRPELNLSVNESHKEIPSVYPNPAVDVLNAINAHPKSELLILDCIGNKVLHLEALQPIDISGLKSGVYYLLVKNQESLSQPVKFVKN
jgi:hypothetical protein